MSAEIDEMLNFLFVNNTSSSQELSERLKIQPKTCNLLLNFLSQYSFIEINNLEITLNPKMRHFIYSTLHIKSHKAKTVETKKIYAIEK